MALEGAKCRLRVAPGLLRHRRRARSDLILPSEQNQQKLHFFHQFRIPVTQFESGTLCRKQSIGQREHAVLRLPAESAGRCSSARELC